MVFEEKNGLQVQKQKVFLNKKKKKILPHKKHAPTRQTQTIQKIKEQFFYHLQQHKEEKKKKKESIFFLFIFFLLFFFFTRVCSIDINSFFFFFSKTPFFSPTKISMEKVFLCFFCFVWRLPFWVFAGFSLMYSVQKSFLFHAREGFPLSLSVHSFHQKSSKTLLVWRYFLSLVCVCVCIWAFRRSKT